MTLGAIGAFLCLVAVLMHLFSGFSFSQSIRGPTDEEIEENLRKRFGTRAAKRMLANADERQYRLLEVVFAVTGITLLILAISR